MSYKQLSPAWEADLPCPSKLILISLADQANDEGICWPGIATLTKRTGLDERSIYRHLAALEKAGHIHREARPGRSNIYHVHPVARVTPDKNVTTITPDKIVTPDTQSPLPLTESHPTPDTQSPITVIEPKVELTSYVSHEKIVFDGSKFVSLNGYIAIWKTAYPAVDIKVELGKAAAWLVANPKNKKSNYARFLNNWFSRVQDKAPRVETSSRPTPMYDCDV